VDQQDDKLAAAVNAVYNGKQTELDAQQVQQQQQRAVSPLNQTQQHNPAAVPASALPPAYAGPISPVDGGDRLSFGTSSGLKSQSIVQQQQQGYHYQPPDGGAQELSGMPSYQYDPGVVTQEMPVDSNRQYVNRYELQ
jgi:hypothetical protein